MLESVEKLRTTGDNCTQMAWVEDKFETVWITKSVFTQLLDDIEHEHGKKLHDATCKAHADGERSAMKQLRSASEDYRRGYEQGFSDADLKVGSDLRELGYIKLPVDADGVPIRFWDKVTVPWSDKVYTVTGLSSQRVMATGQETIWVNTGGKALCGADSCHHYNPPTVEDVLEEYRVKHYDLVTDMDCKNITNEEYVQGIRELASEYAERLQLKAGEDE